jgi:hypothetical protein
MVDDVKTEPVPELSKPEKGKRPPNKPVETPELDAAIDKGREAQLRRAKESLTAPTRNVAGSPSAEGDQKPRTPKTPLQTELALMRRISNLLADIPPDSAARVTGYLYDHFSPKYVPTAGESHETYREFVFNKG